MINLKNLRLGMIGLGYVGLPLAVEFVKTSSVIGFDIDKNRINIIDPLVGSISAFIIIKADNAKVPTENNINPIIPLNTFIIQDYRILNPDSS